MQRCGTLSKARFFLGSTLVVALAACSGGGGGGSQGGPLPGSGSSSSDARSVPVTFTMHWTSPSGTASSTRRPAYVPATARSVSVAVNGGTPQYLNSPTPTITISAPAGVDTFAFAVYDEQNGQGNVLSQASITQTVVVGTANVLSATLNGVIASLTLALNTPKPNAGVPATINVNVAALDADSNVIVGPGDYSTPIQLKVTIPATAEAAAATLSTATLQNPAATATLAYTGATLTTATVTASASGVPGVSTTLAPTPTFYQFSIPTAANRPQWIAAGSDGNMWFTESPGSAVARITPAGVVTEFTIPTANAQPQQIINASDGNLWFTELSTTPAPGTSKIAKVTTAGVFTEYSTLFVPPPADNPLGLVDRGDGNVWYVANGSSRIGFQGITNGIGGETSVPTANSGPFGIATAPDNNLYYTESGVDKIGRITNIFTTQAEITLTTGTTPEAIVRGPDGNLWFTENGTNKIGRLSSSSFSVTGEFPTTTPNSAPVGIAVGQDGALWFTESAQDRIGRITTGGTVTEFASPVTGLGLRGIGVAPDGSLWLAEPGTGLNPGRIGKLVY